MVDQRNGKVEVVMFCAALSRKIVVMLLPASNAWESLLNTNTCSHQSSLCINVSMEHFDVGPDTLNSCLHILISLYVWAPST